MPESRSKNANVDFLRSRMRAKKNSIIAYVDGTFKDEREQIVNWAIHRARKNRKESRSKEVDIKKELSRRAALKTQKKVERERKDVEVKVKSIDVQDIAATFPDLSGTM